MNTTDSAVRITHLPAGLTVSCQNERSQAQNRAFALKMLKSKLAHLAGTNRLAERKKIRGEYVRGWEIRFGRMFFQPYKLVRITARSMRETDPQSVLDGNLDGFIEAYLRKLAGRKKIEPRAMLPTTPGSIGKEWGSADEGSREGNVVVARVVSQGCCYVGGVSVQPQATGDNIAFMDSIVEWSTNREPCAILSWCVLTGRIVFFLCKDRCAGRAGLADCVSPISGALLVAYGRG